MKNVNTYHQIYPEEQKLLQVENQYHQEIRSLDIEFRGGGMGGIHSVALKWSKPEWNSKMKARSATSFILKVS